MSGKSSGWTFRVPAIVCDGYGPAGAWESSVPARYRHAAVSREQARRIAAAALEELQCCGEAFGELSEGRDEGAVWHFTAEDYAPQKRGWIPGNRSFLVDKLDGHLWSISEVTAFRALSSSD